MKQADVVNIRILNQTGQVVQTVSYPQQAAGQHQEQLSLSWYSEGVYIVMVHIGDWVQSRKLVVSR